METSSVQPTQDQPQVQRPWHAMGAVQVAESLETDLASGLTTAEAGRRLEVLGPNLLQQADTTPWYVVLGRQFTGILIIILVVAAIVALVVGEVTDSIVILAIVVLNGALGFTQEWRSEQAIQALRAMLAPQTTVVRDGVQQSTEAADLVPGDLVVLEAGDRIPADLRLVSTATLQVDQSTLTGESVPVDKSEEPVDGEVAMPSRTSMGWMGTTVTRGRCSGIVAATGMFTEFGRIAKLTQEVDTSSTPLQRRLAILGRQLGILSVALSVLVVVVGLITGKPVLDMFLTGISLAVAVVPEGLPAVVTITLALGIRSMVRRNALLRRLQAAETLGSASVICTDKTGTLTQNEMTVQKVWMPSAQVDVTGSGYAPDGEFRTEKEVVKPDSVYDLNALLETVLICNNSSVYEDDGAWQATGDPTEVALVSVAMKAGLSRSDYAEVTLEVPFDSTRKLMSVVLEDQGSLTVHAKGAPEAIFGRCSSISDSGEVSDFTDEARQQATDAYFDMAAQGMRVLAVAQRTIDSIPDDPEEVEQNLTLIGLVGMVDPPRPEVGNAIAMARSAGVSTVMITGDSPQTALAIGRQIGLSAQRAVTGEQLTRMSDDDLRQTLGDSVLFARTSPEQKVRIVSALQDMGRIVAMTGDGVNDAPSLRRADIGVAMGMRGTDVARSASEMVLLDDNYASIVEAVREGRRQYDNIQKFVVYLLSSNVAELTAVLVNIVLGGPLILLPVQILWINLITDGITAVALGLEPAEKDVMRRSPRPPNSEILSRNAVVFIIGLGTFMGLATFWAFESNLGANGESADYARTVAFTTLILMEKMNVFNTRSLREPLAVIGFLSNPWVVGAWTAMVGLHAAAIYVPFMQDALHTVPLDWQDWVMAAGFAIVVLAVVESIKIVRWRSVRKVDTETV